MKIAYIVEDFSENGGVERIVTEKANSLSAEYGHEVSIVSVYADKRPELYRLAPSIRMVHLAVPFADRQHGPVVINASRIATLAKAAIRLNKALKRLKPDIIFFTTTLGALLLPLCTAKARKVYESHLARQFNPFNSFFPLMERMADTVVCLTEGDAMEFAHAKNKTVIPNFIKKPSSTVKSYDTKKAIAVGRLERQKGFDILIDAWQEIARQHPDWHLDIYGEGTLREELQQQIDGLALSGSVTLCGRSNEMMSVYPQYSLHLMPSRYEGQPMTLIEAQACGLPSVVTNFKYGAADVIRDGFNGFIVDQGDSSQFTAAVSRMMDDPALRRRLGEHAIETSATYYKENIIGKWIELIGKG